MAKQKNPAAVALGRLGAKKGGDARAANLTQAQRSDSARKAVQARWAKSKSKEGSDHIAVSRAAVKIKAIPATVADTSDIALLSLLKQIKATDDLTELRRLSDELERVIFHKQFKSA